MRIVFLTSDPRVAGLTSDDGFEIGVISSASGFLIFATTFFGGMIGPLAAIVRRALGAGTMITSLGFGVATATFLGGAIVHYEGIDFRLLDPLYLTVGLFILIPGAAAATGVVFLDRMLRPEGRIDRLPSAALSVVAVLALFPAVVIGGAALRNLVSLVVIAAVGLAALAISRIGDHPDASRARRAARWAAWGLLAAMTVAGVLELARDIASLT